MKKVVTILAIETSCDETAAAVLRGDLASKDPSFETLSSVVKSQIKIHSPFGGVVPEVAARAHVASIRPVVEKALADARASLIPNPSPLTNQNPSSKSETVSNIKISNAQKSLSLSKVKGQRSKVKSLTGIDYIAVTSGPGLIMSLLVGVEFAKGLSFATGIPLLPVNHMEGHLFSPFGLNTIDNSQLTIHQSKIGSSQRSIVKGQMSMIQYPILSVVVSGGHTMLVLQKSESHYKVLGSTVDDAAGEAFDKVAKLLELPYPGGPQISKLALEGEANIDFPRPMLDKPNFDFSFSGLKTAVLYYLQDKFPLTKKLKNKPKGGLHHYNFGHIPKKAKADIARSFEEAVVDVLVTKAMRAVKKYKCKTVTLAGGVAANKHLRESLQVKCQLSKVKCIVPDFKLCTDNAEMIAIAGYIKLRAKEKTPPYYKVKADSSWEI